MALENPGFELGYRPLTAPDGSKPHHVAFVYEVDVTGGTITKRYTVERGEIHNPAGWWSWYAHQRNDETPVPWDQNNTIGWAEPEVRLSEPEHNRHRSGARAGYLFTWRRIHEGGLFQQVPVQAGKVYRFTAYAHAWISNDDSQPPSCSLPGCGPLAWRAGTPGLSDSQRSVMLQVGIDPTGGIDPYAPTVIWGDGWHIFNAYRAEPLAVEATAQAATVTVFLKSSTLWPVIHNDVAWDDCALTVIDAPPPTPGRGAPRVQYARTYLLVHPSEPAAMHAGAQEAMTALGVRLTQGSSADDGGIGDLDARTVIALNPALWETQGTTLAAFYAQHYPGVEYVPIYATTPADLLPELRRVLQGAPPPDPDPEPPAGIPVWSQNDPRWANQVYAGGATFAQSGCLVVCVAMRAGVEPPETARRLREAGAFNGAMLSYPQRIPTAFPHLAWAGARHWRNVPADLNLLRQEIVAGNPPIIEVRWSPAQGGPVPGNQHFALVESLSGEDATIIDPWDGRRKSLRTSRYALPGETPAQIIQGVRLVRQATAPPPPPPGGNTGQLLSLHIQSVEPGTLEFLRDVRPNVVKVFDLGLCGEIAFPWGGRGTLKQLAQRVVYRHHISRADELACLADPVNRARWFLDQFAAQALPLVQAGLIDYIETAINETMDGDNVQAAVNFELAFVAELARRLPGAKPLVATIAVGNPHESQYPLLLPLAREIQRAGGAFGYHAYWPVDSQRSFLVSDWQWHAGRFEGMDAVFRQATGRGVDWILSEVGPCGGVKHPHYFAFDPAAGWRHPQCFAGDFNLTLADTLEFTRRLKQSPARVLGATWFTICGWDWEWFNLNAEQLARLAQALRA